MRNPSRSFRARQLSVAVACCVLAVSVMATTPAVAAYRQTYQFVSKNLATQGGSGIQPYGIGIGADGSVFLGSNSNYAAKLDTDWSLLALLGLGYDHIWDPVAITPFDQVRGIAVDGSDVWVLDYSNGAAKFGNTGHFTGPAFIWQFNNPTAIAVDASHAVYIADGGSMGGYSQRVTVFHSDGSLANIHFGDIGGIGPTSMQYIRGIAVSRDFTVYVADDTAGKIWRYRRDVFATGMNYLGWWSNALYDEPIGVASASDGSLFVLDGDTATVTKLDSTGKVLGHWGGFGTANGMFSNPMGIAVDASGTVYVTDRDAQTVQMFAPLDLGPTTQAAGTVTVKKGKTASFKYMGSDDFSNSVNVTIKIYKGKSLKKTISCGKVSQGSWHTKTWKDTLAKGTYTWKVYASDLTGHAQRNVASKTFRVK